ncbi:hypothetical protein Trydic_g2503 [Trypoxylus dichotomus]
MIALRTLLVTLLHTLNYHYIHSQNPVQLIESLTQKVLELEQTGQIKRDYDPYIEPRIQNKEEYDFIIVGAGSSGSALVRRLTEIARWKILLLEAGGEPGILTDIPYWSPIYQFTDLNWGYLEEKEDNFGLGLKDQRVSLIRGKGLGGSSMLNYMIFSRGAKEDYDKWASLGNPGWSYEDVLPYFVKLENCTVPIRDELYRGHDGPISVQDTYHTTATDTFVRAARNSGYNYVDYNGRTNRGVSFFQATTKDGFRCSGERCYIRPIKYRKNLTIRLNSHVTKVLIQNNTAYGVRFYKNGRLYTAYARKEVILCAGAINSPQILLLSGIGPEQQLLKFGIKPVRNLPVGQKMYDHVAYFTVGFTFNQSIAFDSAIASTDKAFIELYNENKGPLTSLSGGGSILFTRSNLAPDRAPDIEIAFVANHVVAKTSNAGSLQVTDEVYEYTFKPYEDRFLGNCYIVLLHPRSYGRVELQSANPFVYPKIYGGFFTDPGNRDMETIIAGIRETHRIMLSSSFAKYGVAPMDKPVFGCQHYQYNSDEYWECAVRSIASTVFHPTTTCKMGPASDAEAVVDARLRVHGIRDLRVVDTSIIPVTLSGHTNIPAYMVAERAADMIKEEYLMNFETFL